jgi:preprotein translocase subunit SecE
MERLKSALRLLASCLIYSLIITSLDFLIVYFFTQGLSQLLSTVSFILLLEGGLGLIMGGGAVMYSPVASKVGEILFKSEPWNAKRQKEVEKQAQVLIFVGIFLLAIGLLVSAI